MVHADDDGDVDTDCDNNDDDDGDDYDDDDFLVGELKIRQVYTRTGQRLRAASSALFFLIFSLYRCLTRLLRRFFFFGSSEANAAKQTTSSAHAHTIAASWADTAVQWADAVQKNKHRTCKLV